MNRIKVNYIILNQIKINKIKLTFADCQRWAFVLLAAHSTLYCVAFAALVDAMRPLLLQTAKARTLCVYIHLKNEDLDMFIH